MTHIDERSLSPLLESLYGSIDSPRPWAAFLESLARWMDASYAVLIIAAPDAGIPGTFVAPGADPERSADYVDTFFADDPFQRLPDGEVTAFADFIAQQPHERYRAYRDYLMLAGGEQVIAVDLRFAHGVEARFRVMRVKGLPDFSMRDRARLQSLVAHLRIAVGLFAKLQFAGAQHGLFHSAAEGMGLAMIVLDRQRHIVSSNALAERFLSESLGIRRTGEKLAFTSRRIAEIVDTLLARSEEGDDGDAIRRFAVAHDEGADLAVTARAINLPAIHSGTGALALFLSLPDASEGPDLAMLTELFALTPAEARLAASIARGLSLVDAARIGGITANTAKSQLRAVFAKTGTNRQSQLAAKLAALSH